ncbi:hypothetical protein C6I20_10765 [Aeromicrobium sp. A1-2]|nr:hypothetical protein C6I20_10765 [Aeromicrobium sp. A1-2]
MELGALALELAAAKGFAGLTVKAMAEASAQPASVVEDLLGRDDDLVEYVIVEEMGQTFAEMTVMFGHDLPARDVVVGVCAYAYRRLADTVTFRELLDAQRQRLMEHTLGDRPETLILARDWLAEEYRLLGERAGEPIEADGAAEFSIRLMLSLLTSPQLGPDLSEDGVVEAIIRRWLLPGIFA